MKTNDAIVVIMVLLLLCMQIC